MKVLLNLFYNRELDDFKVNEYPLGLLSLAEYAKERIPEIEFKVIAGPIELHDVEEFKPDIIGFSSISQFFTLLCTSIDKVKSAFPNVSIILGGYHITYIPSNLPKNCDVGVIGEGEYTFYQLCEIWKKHKAFPKKSLAQQKGIIYYDNEKFVNNQDKNLPLAPDEIPIIKNYDICSFKIKKPIRYHVITSRGCPYKCKFCSSAPFWGRIRYYDPVLTVKQIEYIVETYSPYSIHIFDDLMISNKARLKEISKLIYDKGIHKKTIFECWVAGVHLDEATTQMLSQMNTKYVDIAVESGSPDIYKYLKGSWNTPNKNAEAMKRAKKHGISISISVIVGSPPEKSKDLQKTYDFLKKVPFNGGSVYLLKAFPGSYIWDYAKKRGLVSDDMENWMKIDSDAPLNPNTIFLPENIDREIVHRYMEKIKRLIKKRVLLDRVKKICSYRFMLSYFRRKILT